MVGHVSIWYPAVCVFPPEEEEKDILGMIII